MQWEVVNSGGNVSASTGLALSTSANGIGRREVHGMPVSVGARRGCCSVYML